MPFVKMRQAIFCGIVVSEIFSQWVKHSRLAVSKQEPAAATFTGNIELHQRSGFGWNGSICMGQRTHEAIKNWIVELARHDSRFVDGEPDLLLMMPALSELTRGVEPVRRFFFPRPAHGKHRRNEWIERLIVFGVFSLGRFHPGNQFDGA